MGYAPKDLGSRPGDIGYDPNKHIETLEVYKDENQFK